MGRQYQQVDVSICRVCCQTGSGKTHTMVGPRLSRALEPGADPAATASSSEDGLLPRCILAAFASMKQREADTDFTVSATCLELYNEAVTDLLGKDSTKQLQVG